jgi:hypothetical protein
MPSPESWTRFILSATALTCSVVATELPPYFCTMIPKTRYLPTFLHQNSISAAGLVGVR